MPPKKRARLNSDMTSDITNAELLEAFKAYIDIKIDVLQNNVIDNIKNKLDILKNDIDELKCQLNEKHATMIAPLSSPPSNEISALIAKPKVDSDKKKKEEIIKLIQKENPKVDAETANAIYKSLNDAALQVVRDFTKEIKVSFINLTSEQKMRMFNLTANDAIARDFRLSFLKRCSDLWSCEFVVQPKYSSKVKNIRIKEAVADARRILQQHAASSSFDIISRSGTISF